MRVGLGCTFYFEEDLPICQISVFILLKERATIVETRKLQRDRGFHFVKMQFFFYKKSSIKAKIRAARIFLKKISIRNRI